MNEKIIIHEKLVKRSTCMTESREPKFDEHDQNISQQRTLTVELD